MTLIQECAIEREFSSLNREGQIITKNRLIQMKVLMKFEFSLNINLLDINLSFVLHIDTGTFVIIHTIRLMCLFNCYEIQYIKCQ